VVLGRQLAQVSAYCLRRGPRDGLHAVLSDAQPCPNAWPTSHQQTSPIVGAAARTPSPQMSTRLSVVPIVSSTCQAYILLLQPLSPACLPPLCIQCGRKATRGSETLRLKKNASRMAPSGGRIHLGPFNWLVFPHHCSLLARHILCTRCWLAQLGFPPSVRGSSLG